MISSAKSNMYEVNARSVLDVYGEFAEGTGREVALAVSTRSLGDTARNALRKSFAALGYGSDACAWVTTTVGGAADAGADAGAGGRGATGEDADAGGREAAGVNTDPNTRGAAGAGSSLGGTADEAGRSPLPEVRLGAYDLMSVAEGLDPLVMVAADAEACDLLGRSYRLDFPAGKDCVIRVMGRTCALFCDFESMMTSEDGRQRAWALLKKLPKLR